MADEFKLQWSVSLPPVAQYAKGHMFNFRADDAHEMNRIFDEVLAAGTVQKALEVAALLTAAKTVTDVVAPAGQEPAVPAGQETSNVTALKTCAHGVRERKSGTNKRGPWVGYYCPQPRNATDRCEPIYE